MGTFAQDWWRFNHAKSNWEDDLTDLLPDGMDFDRIRTDDYDASLEIDGASNDLRLSEAMQRFIHDAGFGKAYVNHIDAWQTHYTLRGDLPVRPWRRRYVEDASAETTNVLAGEPNPGYYEISHWPVDWTGPGTADWLATGYMRIVPDALTLPAGIEGRG